MVTLGYVIIRVAMVAHWLRAARGDAGRRPGCMWYAAGTLAVQVGRVLRLLFFRPGAWRLLRAGLRGLLVPPWAAQGTAWHSHHIAERYGLFTICVLVECVLAATAIPAASPRPARAPTWWFGQRGADVAVRTVVDVLPQGGQTGPGAAPPPSFAWGHGHYGIFAALAALGVVLGRRGGAYPPDRRLDRTHRLRGTVPTAPSSSS